jgi:hypothetical protein
LPIIWLTVSILYTILSLLPILLFYRKRKYFPLRGRAPLVTLLQAIYFWMILFIPLFAEILLKTDAVDWKDWENNEA